jgi:hypothetical protein
MPDLQASVTDGWHGIINRELKRIRCPEHGEQDLVLVDAECGCQDCAECQRELRAWQKANLLKRIYRRWFG